MNDREILLSTEKVNKFERMISRAVEERFGVEVNVTVKTNGRVYVRAADSRSDAAVVVQEQYGEVLDVVSELDLSEGASSYELVDGDNEGLIGASFYLKRSGW